MKVKDLQKILEECGPETEVLLTVPVGMFDRSPRGLDDGLEYSLEPRIEPMWDLASCEGPATKLYIEIAEIADI